MTRDNPFIKELRSLIDEHEQQCGQSEFVRVPLMRVKKFLIKRRQKINVLMRVKATLLKIYRRNWNGSLTNFLDQSILMEMKIVWVHSQLI